MFMLSERFCLAYKNCSITVLIYQAKSMKADEISNKHLNYNHVHNILRLFDGLPNFPFTKDETKPDH